MSARRWFNLVLAAFAGSIVVIVGSRGGWWLVAAVAVNMFAFGSTQALCHAVVDLAVDVRELIKLYDAETRP